MNDGANAGNGQAATPAVGARPAVLSLSIKEKAALYAAYMPYLRNGGIFVPTTRAYQLGDDVYLILTLLDDPTRARSLGREGREHVVANHRWEQSLARLESMLLDVATSARRTRSEPAAESSRTP